MIERTGGEGGWKEAALKELSVWEDNYLDVGVLQGEVEGLRQANSTLQDELAKLRQANMVSKEAVNEVVFRSSVDLFSVETGNILTKFVL